MYKFDPQSGATVLFNDLGVVKPFNGFAGAVDVTNNSIVAVSNDNAINVLNLHTGEYLWDKPLGEYLPFSNYPPSPPVCTEDICYAMGLGGDLVAVNIRTRTTLWSVDLFPSEERFLDVVPLVVTEKRIFASASNEIRFSRNVSPKLHVVSRATGAIETTLPGGKFAVKIANDLLLVSGNGLIAYDINTLQQVWKIDVESASHPAVIGDTVVFHMVDSNTTDQVRQQVVAVNRIDGSVLWSQDAGNSNFLHSPVTDGELIYSRFFFTRERF